MLTTLEDLGNAFDTKLIISFLNVLWEENNALMFMEELQILSKKLVVRQFSENVQHYSLVFVIGYYNKG